MNTLLHFLHRVLAGLWRWLRECIELVDDHLQVFLFGLMCIGLVLASWFLMIGLISGDNWVTVCGILFGSNALGSGLSQIGRGRRTRPDESGYARPVE